ncbi:MAG: hypothetical protein RIC14_08475 [Filomicrobium sp.]
MDIVAITESLKPVSEWLVRNWSVIAITLSLYVLFLWSRGFWKRVLQVVEKVAFSNWQLALLGATGLVLSLASGWTTWDGMRNFTNEPVLSLMITFGIQGVMLIVAWLIGESFASGMNVQSNSRSNGRGGVGFEWVIGAFLGAGIVFGLVLLMVRGSLPITQEQILFGGVAIGIIALIAVVQGDLLTPYIRSSKIILRNAVLWIMFLSCMATSVFFSFDSLFSTIFPQEERARAAELRAQNQVAGIVSDIGQTIETRRLSEAEALFKSKGWQAYEIELSRLAGRAQGAQRAIEEYFVGLMEERRRAVAEQQERRASAESQQAAIQVRSVQLNEEIARLQASRPEAAAAVEQQRQVVSEIQRRLDEQRAIVLAEEKGVEGTGRVGRGRQWRAERATEGKIRAELQVANERLASPQRRVDKIDKRISTIKAELAQIAGQIAQLKGEAQTAEQRILATERTTGIEEASLKVDPARVLPAFERAKVAFRQEPTQQRLNDLQQQCSQLLKAMTQTPTTKESVRDIDCDPRQAGEAAAIVFALNQGTQVFLANCAGGERLEKLGSTDALFGFARKCLSDSGLPSEATDELRTKINLAELNRDDKAHRFVVTWNAFNDGNRLAYLALAIAIAIDALVFMSGLFGANAVRSPLQDVPRYQARSAQQLEAVIETGLQPHPYENARATIAAMRPIVAQNGFTQKVVLDNPGAPDYAAVLSVVNAARSIGAADEDPNRPHTYLIRPELFEFLSVIAHRHYQSNDEHKRLAELNRLVTVSLQPHVGDHADIVLHNMHPINDREGTGYTSEILLKKVNEPQVPVVRRVLNAGAVLNFIRHDSRQGEDDRYYVHKDLYKTLMMIAAANPVTGTWLDARPLRAKAAKKPERLPAATPQVAASNTQLLSDQRQASNDDSAYEEPEAQDDFGYEDMESNEDIAFSDALRDDHSDLGYFAGDELNEDVGKPEPGPEQYRDYFERELLNALGFDDTDRIKNRLEADGVKEAAMDAWKVLKHHCNRNAILNGHVDRFGNDRDVDFSKVYSSLRSDVGSSSPEAADQLERVMSELNQQLPVLLLFPELGLIPYLIERLEDANVAGHDLNDAEQHLLQRLRNVNELIRQTDLTDVDTWQQIKDTISGWEADERNVSPQKKDPNSGVA